MQRRPLSVTETLPPSVPHGEALRTREAATIAARRLGVETPVDRLSPAALRKRVRELHAEHRARGGTLGLPNLAPLNRAELEDLLRKLRGVRSLSDV